MTEGRPAGASGGAAPGVSPRDDPRPGWIAHALGGATGAGVLVAVIDSGWDRALADPRVLPGIAVPVDDGAASVHDDGDRLGHGTATASRVLAVAPDARVLPVRVFVDRLETSPGALVAAIDRAAEAGARVINLSLGTSREVGVRALYAACERARRAGAIVVAAGDADGGAGYPAAFDHVIGVAAGAFESPYAWRYRPGAALEIEAAGLRLPTTGLGGHAIHASGTSVAAANGSGLVALLLQHRPDATVEDIREMLAAFAID